MALKDLIYKLNNKIMGHDFIALFVLFLLPPFKYMFGNRYKYLYEKISFKRGIDRSQLFLIANKVKKTTPFYPNSKHPIISSLESFEEYFKPFDKDEMVREFKNLISVDFKKSGYELMTTGGTSGLASQFYVSKSRYKKEYAFYHKIWSTLGYKQHLRGVLRNEKLDKSQVYKINPITREIVFDGFRNNDNYYEEIYNTLIKFKVQYIQGYPSSIYNFFIYLNKHKRDINFIKGVFLSSEIFLEHQRSFLVQDLKLPIISVYGHSEKLALAVDFKGTGIYQIIEEYGYVELVDQNNKTIKKEGIIGEIVATTFDNFGMPLVRYKTGDYSSYYKYSETEARLLNGIQGRWNEMKIYNKDGSFITPTALNLHDQLNKCINGLQYVQNEKGILKINIIPNQFYNQQVEDALYIHFKDRMAQDSVIEIKKVEHLRKKPNGKFLILETTL